MLRTLTCAVAALMLAGPSALAAEFSDVGGTFRLTAPDGWTTETPPIPTLAVVLASPRRTETGGNCNVVVLASPETKSMTQAQVEAEMSGQINETFWKTLLANVKGIKSSKIEKWGDKTHRGRKVHYVKATSEIEIGALTLKVTQVQDIHAIPGRAYGVTCTAFEKGFEREAAEFDAIMTSFEPLTDMTVAAVRGAPSPFAPQTQGPALARAAAAASSDALAAGAFKTRR